MIDSQISHYKLTRSLGEGTYGEVYEGVHVHNPNLRVAIKVVTAQVRLRRARPWRHGSSAEEPCVTRDT